LIPNGHELDKFRQPLDFAKVRAGIGVRPDERMAIYVGRLIDTKRVCDLIDAVAQVAGVNRGLRVVIVGDGPKSQCRHKPLPGTQRYYYNS
jgi:glycosyltransferase involved in cell wall biosynthesis